MGQKWGKMHVLKGFYTPPIGQTLPLGNFDEMKTEWLKTAGVTALAFIAYRAYKLWELANSFSYRYTGLYFRKPKNIKELLNKFSLVLEVTIMNPTNTTFRLNGVRGGIYHKGVLLGTFALKGFTIQAGDTPVKAEVLITPQNASALVKQIIKGEYPVFDVRMDVIMPFGFVVKQGFKVNSKDYLPKNALNIFI